MSTETEPNLAPPGAGLPAPELFIAKKLFALKCRSGSRENFIEGFEDERAKIKALLNTCPKEQRGEQVLISRLRGLEDSSRHWSVWMTLDHLHIVNEDILSIMSELSHGRTPEGEVSTADLKPDPDVTESIVDEFEEGCADFPGQVAIWMSSNPKPSIHILGSDRWMHFAGLRSPACTWASIVNRSLRSSAG